MTPAEKPNPTVSTVLQELDALRGRLDEAADWYSNPKATLRAVALSEEVGRLCRQASLSQNPHEVERLAAAASRCLDEMQTLLGVH